MHYAAVMGGCQCIERQMKALAQKLSNALLIDIVGQPLKGLPGKNDLTMGGRDRTTVTCVQQGEINVFLKGVWWL